VVDIIEALMENPKRYVALVFSIIFLGLGLYIRDLIPSLIAFGFAAVFLLEAIFAR